ncbi:MAG: hypothetical protein JWO81_582 [Alphaproteobacteria bacterium]|nr:hypothetical protein [Alphaproteobacteria bacterium]
MRKALGFIGLIFLAGCSRGDQESRARQEAGSPASDTAADRNGVPGITPTAAPGVAFNYRYAFRLPADRIAGVQEEHALACEKLGLARCRITGMSFHRTSDRDVEARLDFKLDPAIARAFGKQGNDTVARADGLLAEAEITGEDAGGAIAAATRDEARQDDELKKIEAQLARAGLGSAERAQLQAQAQQIRESLRASQADKSEKQDSLAKTPLTFAYQSGDMAPGVRRALTDGFGNVVDALEWMLLAAITLLPWALLGLLVWRLIRRFRPAPVIPAG